MSGLGAGRAAGEAAAAAALWTVRPRAIWLIVDVGSVCTEWGSGVKPGEPRAGLARAAAGVVVNCAAQARFVNLHRRGARLLGRLSPTARTARIGSDRYQYRTKRADDHLALGHGT